MTLSIAGLAPNASRFRLRNEFIRDDGELSCRVTSVGGWLDLRARKLIVAPRALLDAYLAAERSDDFEELKPSVV